MLRTLLDKADRYLVGGCLGSFRLPDEVATVIARGEGSKVFDVDGREYIDYILGSGPMILGHAHPAVVGAVQRQAALGSTFYVPSAPTINLAERVVEAAPCGERIRFVSSGTEATFAALRMARAQTGREKILKFEGGWHGGHDYAQQGTTPTEPADYPQAVPDCAGIPSAVGASVLVAPFNDTEASIRLIEASADDIAAVIVEPLQRTVPPQPGFLEALREATSRHGIALIFDEIVTGFRLAWGGAQEGYGVVPDLATYGKTISGGYPIAAVCGRADILDCGDPRRKGQGQGDYAFVSGTVNGNPIGAAAGLACLDELAQDGVYARLYEVSERLRQGLLAIGKEAGVPLQVLGDGPVLQPFFTETIILNHADSLAADAAMARLWNVEMIKRGVLCNPGGKLYLSLAHSDDDIDRTLQVAQEALAVVVR